MTFYEYGDKNAEIVLIQPVDDHDMEFIGKEVEAIQQNAALNFCLIAAKVQSWNHDLAPWTAPAVFGNESFGNGGADTLGEILNLCGDPGKIYYIGGYSLAGLFALWASYQTDVFTGVAVASPSVWFPGFADYVRDHECKGKAVYLSLGDREEKTRNPVMAMVGDCIRSTYDRIRAQNIRCILEWNQGNHFEDPDLRTAKAFAWLINERQH